MMKRRFQVLVILSTALVLTACGVALAEDVTPPPGSTLPTVAPATETVQAVLEPTLEPTSAPTLEATQKSSPGTATVTSEPILLSFAGKVTTPDGLPLPGNPLVDLQVYDSNQQLVNTLTARAGDDGSVSFENVVSAQGQVYVAMLVYNGVTFYSEFIHDADLSAFKPLDISIKVAETTSDASGVSAERLHIFFDFSQPGIIQVAELFIINNPTDKIIVAANEGDPVLLFNLPQGATDLQFQDGALGERYVQTATGFGDTQAVAPGNGQQVLFGFNLAYQDGMTVSLPMPLDVDAAVVMIPAGSVNIRSGQLADAGEREVDNSTIHLYMGTDLAAGSALQLTISGAQTGAASAAQTGLPVVWVIVLAMLGIGVIGAGIFLLLRGRRVTGDEDGDFEPDLPSSEDELLDAILVLDDQYQTGSLAQDVYEERRAELKQRIKEIRENE